MDSLGFYFEKVLDSLRWVYRGQRVKYEQLFQDDRQLRELFYSDFSLSGAAFVVADNLSRDVVLLQKETNSNEREERLCPELRIRPSQTGRGIVPDVEPAVLDEVVNRLFQQMRREELTPSPRNGTLFTSVPDFLRFLSEDGDSNTDRDLRGWCDYVYCSAEEIASTLVVWRWLLWRALDNKDLSDLSMESVRSTGEANHKLMGTHHKSIDLLKVAANLMDLSVETVFVNLDSAIRQPNVINTWKALRRAIDVKFPFSKFSDELSLFMSCLGADYNGWPWGMKMKIEGNTIDDFYHGLAEYLAIMFSRGETVGQAIRKIHDESAFPLIPYFYYICIDGIAKEHLAIPLLRSRQYPIRYRVESGSHLVEHTAVVNCLASVNCEGPGRGLARRKIKMLRAVLAEYLQPVIDEFFLGNLVRAREELARKTSGLEHEAPQLLSLVHETSEEILHDESKISARGKRGLTEIAEYTNLLLVMAQVYSGKRFEPAEKACPVDVKSIIKTIVSRTYSGVKGRYGSEAGLCIHLPPEMAERAAFRRTILNALTDISSFEYDAARLSVRTYWPSAAKAMIHVAARQAAYHGALFALFYNIPFESAFRVSQTDDHSVTIENLALNPRFSFDTTAEAQFLTRVEQKTKGRSNVSSCTWTYERIGDQSVPGERAWLRVKLTLI